MKHKTKVLYEVDLLCKSIKRSVPQCAAAHFISEASSRPKGTSCSRRERFIPPKQKTDLLVGFLFWWERVDSNHRRRCQQIYSLPPLATREHSHVHYSKKWSWWTDSNPRPADYKSAALPTELHQRLNAWLLYHKRFGLSRENSIFFKTFFEYCFYINYTL